MYKINNNNIITGYIKQLLHDFNLPKAKVLKAGMKIYKDGYYILNGDLYVCLTTGVFNGVDNKLQRLSSYIYGKNYLNITKNLELNSTLYDSYTHSYLGDYLRFMRDYKHLNLMSMYNCFGGEIGKNIDINLTINDIEYSFKSEDSNSVIYLVPVKFEQEYTIGIDCSSTVEVMACLYSNGKIVSDISLNPLYQNTYFRIGGCRFNKPFVYSKLKGLNFSNDAEAIYLQEKNLKLMIKVPLGNSSSITILEGNFAKSAEMTLNIVGNTLLKDSQGREYLSRKKDKKWYTLDTSTGTYEEILDSEKSYYTDAECETLHHGNWLFGVDYYVKDDEGEPVEEPITLSKDSAYYSFEDSKQTSNFMNYNNYKKFHVINSVTSPIQSSWRGDLFIVKDEGNKVYQIGASGDLECVNENNDDSYKDWKDKEYLSKLQLLFVNDGTSYPFADKLVGYLLGNVITPIDNISDNIRRLQKTFINRNDNDYRYAKVVGEYEEDLRDLSYNFMKEKGILDNSFDSIGYVDKELEKALGKDINHDVGHMIGEGVK